LRISKKLYLTSYKKRIPIDAIIEITNRCNLKCRHCYFKDYLNKGGEVEFEVWREVLKDLRKLGSLFLTFTGGEPLLYPDFFKILKIAKVLNFDIKIFTNGTLVDEEIASEFKSNGVSSVGVSIYGSNERIHDYFTGVKGSFQKAISSIEILKKKGIYVHIKTLLMKRNFEDLRNLRKLAKVLKVDINFDPILTAGYGFNKRILRYRLKIEDIKRFFKRYKKRKIEPSNCGAGRNIISIGYKGDVYPCLMLPISFGNIKEGTVLEIWKRMEFFELKFCEDCSLKEKCFYCPGIVYLEKGDFTRFRIFCELAKS